MSETIKYTIDDAVAFMPLLVGFRPIKSDYIGLTEPLCAHRSPSADILKREWKLHNTATLDMVRSAMAICKTTPLFALGKSSKKTFTGSSGVENTNYFLTVLGRIAKIEKSMKTFLNETEIKKTIVKNVLPTRTDFIELLPKKIGMVTDDEAKSLLLDYFKKGNVSNASQMDKIFKLTSSSSDLWNGLGLFDGFWDKAVNFKPTAGTTAKNPYNDLASTQETSAIDVFIKTIDIYKDAYTALGTKLKIRGFESTVVAAYTTKKFPGVAPETAVDTSAAEVKKVINEYLWNVLLERFEIMDSIVSTFFSLICNSKSLHKKMVQDFMSLAIINCTQSLFSCVIPPADGTKDDMHCKDIIRKFEQVHTAFKAMMESILPSTHTIKEGLGLKLQTVESADAIKSIRNGLYERILKSKDKTIVLLSPPSADSPKPKVFTEIERYLNQQFESLLGSSKAILAPKEIRHSGSVIKAHGNNDDKMKVLKAISETIGIDHSSYAKKIVYLRIYMDSLCYGMFHYASYDDTCHPEKAYFKTMSNPLSQSFGNSTVSSVVKYQGRPAYT